MCMYGFVYICVQLCVKLCIVVFSYVQWSNRYEEEIQFWNRQTDRLWNLLSWTICHQLPLASCHERKKDGKGDHGLTDGQTEHECWCWAAPSQLKIANVIREILVSEWVGHSIAISRHRDGVYFPPSISLFSQRFLQDKGPPLPPHHHLVEHFPFRGCEHQQVFPGGCE